MRIPSGPFRCHDTLAVASALIRFLLVATPSQAAEHRMPVIQEPWIQIAGDPNLGQLTHPKQQPVDFGIWQAADGTWQLWSCIRGTKEPGHPHRASRMGDVQMTWAITASPPSPNLSSRAAISKIAGTKHHEQHPYPALAFTASSLPPHH